MAIRTAIRIIKESVSNDIFNNLIDITNLKEMWEKLYSAYSQVSQGVVYLILQELLNYLHNTKPKRFEKSVISQFIDICFLVKLLQLTITLNHNIWDRILIIIALDFLYNDFETTINRILKSGDKLIDKIQQILVLAKAKFFSKKIIKVTRDFAMIYNKKNLRSNKKKTSSKDKCFHYQKLRHWKKDCRFLDH